MRDFSQLLDALVYTRSRNGKLKLIGDYLKRTPDPDRGWAMAALTGELSIAPVKPALVRALIEERCDPILFRMSWDYVGDMAETVACCGPSRKVSPAEAGRWSPAHRQRLVERLARLGRSKRPPRSRRCSTI
jgi:DNA ligase-1